MWWRGPTDPNASVTDSSSLCSPPCSQLFPFCFQPTCGKHDAQVLIAHVWVQAASKHVMAGGNLCSCKITLSPDPQFLIFPSIPSLFMPQHTHGMLPDF